MKILFVGLGKMGSQMVTRIHAAGHRVAVKDVNPEAVAAMTEKGAQSVDDYSDLGSFFGEDPIVIWLMIPHQFVSDEIAAIKKWVKGAVVVDGGNSDYRNTLSNHKALTSVGSRLVDVGTSGGVHGLEQGFSMMVGGEQEDVQLLSPIFESLAQESGWGHFGKTGTGHFTKMVHNGIEYGIMQAYAEGYRIIKEGPFEDVDLAKLAGVWQHGSINESFLNGLIENMLARDPEFSDVEGVVSESGEARWTLETADELGIEAPVIQSALNVRINSQSGETNYATKFLAQLRNEFGGHAVNAEDSEKVT